jgi:putative colanic acid biosynthesis acetyltransferase WcaF
MKTELSTYDNKWYSTGGSELKRFIWYFINYFIFNTGLFPVNKLKIVLLKLFGAKVGVAIVVKPYVNIKYPWNLTIGDYTWIGESVWIDNLVNISIGSNVCISQGAYLLTGNHDYKKSTFDLVVKNVTLEDGVWIGAKSIICPGVFCKSHSVLSAGSVATKNLDAYSVYQGNPAIKIRNRLIDK